MKRLAILLPLLALAAGARETDSATGAPVVHARRNAMDALFGESGQEVFVSVTNGVVDAGTKAPDGDDDLSYWFNCAYDDNSLAVWVAVLDDDFRCADTCPSNATSCAAWDDDAVEIFIDGEFARLPDSRADGGVHLKHGGEFALVANGAANSDFSGYPNTFFRIDPERFDEKALEALEQSTNAWWSGCSMPFPAGPGRASDSSPLTLYFFNIPWSAMGRTNRPDRIGFNIGVQDDDGGGRRDHALYWTGNPARPFSDESAFGILVFDP